jgi:hypothetical protein
MDPIIKQLVDAAGQYRDGAISLLELRNFVLGALLDAPDTSWEELAELLWKHQSERF